MRNADWRFNDKGDFVAKVAFNLCNCCIYDDYDLLHLYRTEKFVRQAIKILSEEEINELQLFLCEYPDDGDVIKGSNGIRKLRWAASGRGKRGGARIIYFYAVSNERILLLDIYPKNEKTDLTANELENLKKIVQVWLEQIV